ncbi:hypothetical protein OC834_006560 [Tilletia horrida]|nr:hypothetical protein OC834_006560 [Tilletia horrida]
MTSEPAAGRCLLDHFRQKADDQNATKILISYAALLQTEAKIKFAPLPSSTPMVLYSAGSSSHLEFFSDAAKLAKQTELHAVRLQAWLQRLGGEARFGSTSDAWSDETVWTTTLLSSDRPTLAAAFLQRLEALQAAHLLALAKIMACAPQDAASAFTSARDAPAYAARFKALMRVVTHRVWRFG